MTDPVAHVGSVPEPPRQPSVRSRGAWLAAAGLILVKLVKSAKFVKFALFVASLGALALNRPVEAACVIVYAIFVHETGHVLAMKACGIKTSGMYFLPSPGPSLEGRDPRAPRPRDGSSPLPAPPFASRRRAAGARAPTRAGTREGAPPAR